MAKTKLNEKVAFTLAEGATHVGMYHNIGKTLNGLVKSATHVGISHNNRRVAFTLAEVLITLGIIGIVAAMTIPTLVSNFRQRSYDATSNNFTRKLGEALKLMNTNSSLAGYQTTGEFVNELSKNMKIVKVCDSLNLEECFIPQFSNNENTFKTKEFKEAMTLNRKGKYDTETVGVVFADGVSALLAYNKNTKQDPFNNGIVNITSSGNGLKNRTIGLSTDALAILYDVSGFNAPNLYSKDIRGINVTLSAGMTYFHILGTNYSSFDCSISNQNSDDYKKYCMPAASGLNKDYWAGARKACADLGMQLPAYRELNAVVGSHMQEYLGDLPRSVPFLCRDSYSAREATAIYPFLPDDVSEPIRVTKTAPTFAVCYGHMSL